MDIAKYRSKKARYMRWIAGLAFGTLVFAAVWFQHRTLPSHGTFRDIADLQSPRTTEEIACPSFQNSKPVTVVLAMGQSNAANHGQGRDRSPSGGIWFDGRCYAINDPLPGGTGSGGSIWSRLAKSLGADSSSNELLLILFAVDATRLSEWTDPGPISDRLTRLLADLRAQNIPISVVLWQQGEADARDGTRQEDYAVHLTKLIGQLRMGGINAPILLALSTRCRNSGSEDIRLAVAQVARQQTDVFVGPDTDRLGQDFRSDGCHLNEAGLRRAADDWVEALVQRGTLGR